MRPFPGPLTRANKSGHPYVLTREQTRWLRRYFPKIENQLLSEASGIKLSTLHRFARCMGLKKSEEGLKAIKKRQTKAILRTCKKNGYYKSLRGKPVSEACMAGAARMWQEIREGKREHPSAIMKRRDPQRYQQWMERKSAERRETIRKEKLRALYGIGRKTNLTGVVLCPYKKSQVSHRHNALKRGYLLDEDCREGKPGRYVIYYNEQTERGAKFEANCIKDGFKILPDE